jgi:hypothetical protein
VFALNAQFNSKGSFMKQCEICNEFSPRVDFDNDIRMSVCDECIVEMQLFIEEIDKIADEISLMEIEDC